MNKKFLSASTSNPIIAPSGIPIHACGEGWCVSVSWVSTEAGSAEPVQAVQGQPPPHRPTERSRRNQHPGGASRSGDRCIECGLPQNAEALEFAGPGRTACLRRYVVEPLPHGSRWPKRERKRLGAGSRSTQARRGGARGASAEGASLFALLSLLRGFASGLAGCSFQALSSPCVVLLRSITGARLWLVAAT
jgi:hypothetical protein